MSLFTNDIVFTVVIVGIVMILSFLWSEQILKFLHDRSLGQRTYISQRLKDMFVEVDDSRMTLMLVMIGVGPGLILFFLFWPNLVAGILFGVLGAFGGWAIPKPVVDNLYERRTARLVDQMVDSLSIMANGIQAGLSVQQAMDRVVQNMGNPISQEFGLVLQRVQVGNSLDEALVSLSNRIPSPEVQMFVTSVNILNETGRGLAPTFNTIMETIRERQKVQRKIEALTAQGMMQGMIITLVPFIILVMFVILDPSFVKPLFSTTWGLVMLLAVLGLQILGGFLVRKIVKIQV